MYVRRGRAHDAIVLREELIKFTLLKRGVSGYLTDRHSERKEAAERLAERMSRDQALQRRQETYLPSISAG